MALFLFQGLLSFFRGLTARKPPRRNRLHVEFLEDRCVPTLLHPLDWEGITVGVFGDLPTTPATIDSSHDQVWAQIIQEGTTSLQDEPLDGTFIFPVQAPEVNAGNPVQISGISLGGPAEKVVDLTLRVEHGSLAINIEDSEVVLVGNNSCQLTFYGTVRGLNEVLGSLVYHPAIGFEGSDVLQGLLTPESGQVLTRSLILNVPPTVSLNMASEKIWSAIFADFTTTPIPGRIPGAVRTPVANTSNINSWMDAGFGGNNLQAPNNIYEIEAFRVNFEDDWQFPDMDANEPGLIPNPPTQTEEPGLHPAVPQESGQLPPPVEENWDTDPGRPESEIWNQFFSSDHYSPLTIPTNITSPEESADFAWASLGLGLAIGTHRPELKKKRRPGEWKVLTPCS